MVNNLGVKHHIPRQLSAYKKSIIWGIWVHLCNMKYGSSS